MNQPCAHWARSWHSHYGVRRNPGIFFMSFYTSKNNFKKSYYATARDELEKNKDSMNELEGIGKNL